MEHAYFPSEGFISLVAPMDGNASLEVGLVGNEGMLGIPLVLGVAVSPLTCLVQGAGIALRIPAAQFRSTLARSLTMQRALARYLNAVLGQLAIAAGCTRFHVVEARLARWLLMTADRAHANDFHITHELLARMLGVRRVGVTRAASSLRRLKLIKYSRGHVTILDRSGLESASCSCYESAQRLYDQLLKPKRIAGAH
jgi:CRP-like cAMP-binding protein